MLSLVREPCPPFCSGRLAMTDGMDRRLRWPCTAPRAGDTFGVFGSQRTTVSDVWVSSSGRACPHPFGGFFQWKECPPEIGGLLQWKACPGGVGVSSSGRACPHPFGVSSNGRHARPRLGVSSRGRHALAMFGSPPVEGMPAPVWGLFQWKECPVPRRC